MKQRPEVLFSELEIRNRVHTLGGEIGAAFAGRQVAVVGLMKSCLVFMADMIRAIPLDMTCHLLRASGLKEGRGHDRTDITYEPPIPYAGRDVLILDDIVDTGITLNYLLDHIREHRPRSLKVCALINKPGDRKVDVRPDWAAFTIDKPGEAFLVGYGLDHLEAFRGLPYIGTIPRSDSSSGDRRNARFAARPGSVGPEEA